MRELARKQADSRYYLYAPEGIVAGWIKPEDVEAQRLSLPPQVFQRLWENRWTEGSGSFITRAELDRNVDPAWVPQLQGQSSERYFVGLDLGLTRDRTARAVLHLEGNDVVLDDLRVWQGTPDRPVDIAEVEADLESVDVRFGRPEFYLDPWQLQSSIQRLRGSLRVNEFKFTSESVGRLSENLYGLLAKGQMRLYPDDDLERELLRLEEKQTTYGWRIDHAAGGFSDRAMAIGMAALHAVSDSGTNLAEWLRDTGQAQGDDDESEGEMAQRIRKIGEDPDSAASREALRIEAEEEEAATARRQADAAAALERLHSEIVF